MIFLEGLIFEGVRAGDRRGGRIWFSGWPVSIRFEIADTGTWATGRFVSLIDVEINMSKRENEGASSLSVDAVSMRIGSKRGLNRKSCLKPCLDAGGGIRKCYLHI